MGVRHHHGHQGAAAAGAGTGDIMGRLAWRTDGLVHHSDHGARCIGLVYATGVGEFGMPPPTGTVGASYDNAMAESADGAYRTELV